MITPTESLAFSMHAKPGIYAVLVGSGVSRAAKIPTGWEITLDLVRKLAALRKETCEPDPERWYHRTFRKKAGYSDLLNALCGTADERHLLLRSYFEPRADDREEGAKQPTAAHRSLAALAANGFIRVILTTNFDRLIETALEGAGVTPKVLRTPAEVAGALPLIHTPCCVVKLHGDYLDLSIKNTQAELERYPAEVNRLLDRVFDEFGLIVCGWSATWDGALREALQRASSRRFTTYWAVHGEVEDQARRLIEHRAAESVPIKDADEFFSTVQQHIESLQEFARPHPLSTETAVASLKRYLAERRHRIRLSDLVDNVVEQVVETTSDGAFAGNLSRWDDNAVKGRMQGLEAACSTLLALGVTGGSWTEEEQEDHVRPWQRALERLGSRDWPASDSESDLRGYPAMLLLRALGFGAVEADKLWFLERLLKTRVRTSYQTEEAAIQALHPDRVRRSDPVIDSTLSKSMRKCLRPHARRIVPDDTRYTLVFDKLEILLTLASVHADSGPTRVQGALWYFQENGGRILSDIEESLSSRRGESPFVRSHIFGSTADECHQRLKQVREGLPGRA